MQETVWRWQLVFFLAAAVNITTNIVYVFLGSAEEQPFNHPRPHPKQNYDSGNVVNEIFILSQNTSTCTKGSYCRALHVATGWLSMMMMMNLLIGFHWHLWTFLDLWITHFLVGVGQQKNNWKSLLLYFEGIQCLSMKF